MFGIIIRLIENWIEMLDKFEQVSFQDFKFENDMMQEDVEYCKETTEGYCIKSSEIGKMPTQGQKRHII